MRNNNPEVTPNTTPKSPRTNPETPNPEVSRARIRKTSGFGVRGYPEATPKLGLRFRYAPLRGSGGAHA